MEQNRDEPIPAPVTVTRILPNGEVETFRIERPPAKFQFRIDWASRTVIPVESTGRRRPIKRPAPR